MLKLARVTTSLQPHQQRVVDRIQQQPGLVVAHGVGSGKTLSSIAAAEAMKKPTAVVAPAALLTNFQKELAKHAPEAEATYNLESLQRVARGVPPEGEFLIVDEAHRAREPGTKTQQALRDSGAQKRMLLTGTALYNRPHDLANLVNIAAGESVFPQDRTQFDRQYLGEERVDPGFWGRLRGIKPGSKPVLRNMPELSEKMHKWVDYHENPQTDFPTRKDTHFETEMSPEQLDLYSTVMKKAPAWVSYKIRKGLPPSKQESKELNAFLGAARQVALSPGGFVEGLDPNKAVAQSPKIQKAIANLEAKIKTNPDHRAVVYSNYLDAGLGPYEAALAAKNIPFGKFTGDMHKRDRDQMVTDYNAGKLRALLLSSAGGEGLDLKGTRQIQVLEPHWNKEKIEQVIGRGIRYKSHAELPADQRDVEVEHYHSVHKSPGGLAKFFGKKREGAIDEYLAGLSKDKDRLNEQVRGILRSPHEEAA